MYAISKLLWGGGTPTGYPRFNAPDSIADAIEKAGFDVAAVANNHTYDSGNMGIVRTKKILESKNIVAIGTKINSDDKAYCIIERKGIKIGLLNYTYETSKYKGRKTLNNRALDIESCGLVNSFCFETIEEDLENIRKEINILKSCGADIIIAYYHWGNEYEQQSNVIQRYIAYKSAKFGVDAIIGSHSHVLQEKDDIDIFYNGKRKKVPVFYGLGNYIWGAGPIKERDTVLNTILARLIITISNNEKIIETEFVPLYICQKEGSFNTIDLTGIYTQNVKKWFLDKCGFRSEDIVQQINKTLNNKANAELRFEKILTIKEGEIVHIPMEFYGKGTLKKICSEDCLIASVLQNGDIIGNNSGYTGIKAYFEEKEVNFVVRVIKSDNKKLPIVINECNRIRDIYVPTKLVTGEEYAFPQKLQACKDTANAWKLMLLAARSEGIYLSVVSGMRSKKAQLLKRINYAEKYSYEKAVKRYHSFGCSEHHLGVAIDVKGGQYNGKTTTKAQAITWLQKNCAKFGFVPRKLTSTIANTAYIHLRYYGDVELAKFMLNNNLTLEEFFLNYRKNVEKMELANAWKKKYKEDDDKRTLTLRLICEINNIEIPEEFKLVQDRVVPQIILHDSIKIQNGSVFFFDGWLSGEMRRCRNALRSGAVVAFAKQQIFDECGNPMPTIIVADPLEACVKVGKYIRHLYNAKTVCITGTAGKSTTTELLYSVFSNYFNMLTCTKLNNANNRIHILKYIQELKPEHEIYLQEVGGSFPEHIEKSAEMLQPDVAIVTNIGKAHLDLYKTFDNLKKDKLSLLENRSKSGVAIINIDDDNLRKWAESRDEKLITYSLENQNADYFVKRLEQRLDGLYLTIVEKKANHDVEIFVNIVGKHNAYNVLAAYAAGRHLGLSSSQIVSGIKNFHTKGIRQRMCNIGGYHLYIDCFSSVESSLISAIKTLSDMKVNSCGRKIAVIWELMRLGEENDIVERRVAKEIHDYDIDFFIICGEKAAPLVEELRKTRDGIFWINDYGQIVKTLDSIKKPGDVILFKGQHMQTTSLVIDNVFGTNCVINSVGERRNNSIPFSKDIWTGIIMHNSVAIIDKQKNTKTIVEIPDYIDGRPVICLNNDLFKNSSVSEVKIGNNIAAIYSKAFANCRNLTQICFGENVRTIGENSFENCSALEEVFLPANCLCIFSGAFKNCKNLKKIYIPISTKTIAEDAFIGCDNIKIYTVENSYAHQYAKKNCIEYMIQ